MRWALTTALNEVQQQATTREFARLFKLPILERHAAIEREMALRYFACASPRATRELWRQVILLLDGLNAAIFEDLKGARGAAVFWHAAVGGIARRDEWRAFTSALAEVGAPSSSVGAP